MPERRLAPQVPVTKYLASTYRQPGYFSILQEQIASITSLTDVKSIAEVGVGPGFLAPLLRQLGYQVATVDFDESLHPDILASVLDLSVTLQERFDLVTCFEVLEHLPFDLLPSALENLKSISKGKILLSLPYSGVTVRLEIYAARYGERSFRLLKRIPRFWARHRFNGEHYWEIGTIGYSRARVRRELARVVDIEEEWFLPYNHSQIFFLAR